MFELLGGYLVSQWWASSTFLIKNSSYKKVAGCLSLCVCDCSCADCKYIDSFTSKLLLGSWKVLKLFWEKINSHGNPCLLKRYFYILIKIDIFLLFTKNLIFQKCVYYKISALPFKDIENWAFHNMYKVSVLDKIRI